MNPDDLFGVVIAYETLALASKRVPTITVLCQRHHWLILPVLAVIGMHLVCEQEHQGSQSRLARNPD